MKRILVLLVSAALYAGSLPRGADELRFCLHHPPKTLDPLQASESSAEIIRYITYATLIRLDRRTQQVLPELAVSWKVGPTNRTIEFTLRPGIKFNDGSPVNPSDIVYSMKKIVDPSLHSAIGDKFHFSKGVVVARAAGPRTVLITFPDPVAQIAMMFDEMPVLSERSANAVAGPYYVAAYKAGSDIELKRNPYYWKKDEHGVQLPYIGTLKIKFQVNRELELLDFERADIDLIPQLPPDQAERVQSTNAAALVDMGLSLDSLVLFFNQNPAASLPAYKKAWFNSDAFRKALSFSTNREDICRIAYRTKAKPGVGPVSPANKLWFNTAMKADTYSPTEAMKGLKAAGFVMKDNALYDRQGNRVEFSLVTNTGNKTHERAIGLIQQDWKRVGVKLNLVTIDFPSLIERITRTYDFEACLLPLTNISVDPEDQMNVWQSSGANHQWNPSQKTPATAWEKEIDDNMSVLATSVNAAARKKAWDRVQMISSERVPFIYLAHPQALAAVAPGLKLVGAPTWPFLLYGIESARFNR